jgi:hypothetical protein
MMLPGKRWCCKGEAVLLPIEQNDAIRRRCIDASTGFGAASRTRGSNGGAARGESLERVSPKQGAGEIPLCGRGESGEGEFCDSGFALLFLVWKR